MFEPNLGYENARRFSRFDREHLLSSYSDHPITLEDRQWSTAEHYYQASKFSFNDADQGFQQRIIAAPTPESAHKLGNRWFKKKRPDLFKVRQILMTRALYTKVQQYESVREFLLSTEQELLVEVSLYGHYWGIGRDQRGKNHMGNIWMDIRTKLTQESQTESS